MTATPTFRAFTTVANGLVNVLQNECWISTAWHPANPGPRPELHQFLAIWDTGATNSVISQKVVDVCGLAPIGMVKVHGVSGEMLAETYLVNIGLPNLVGFYAVRVTKGELPGSELLIGMDIISQGDFSVTNCGGITKFSFRTPSIEHIDYVEVGQQLMAEPSTPTTRAERRRKKFDRK
jgi:hypothetical protein